jgi:putative ABC transport system substrate-binding protein
MRRRDVIAGLLFAGPIGRAQAQQGAKVYRVGVLSPGAAPLGPLEAFRDGLRDLGYVEGKNVAIDWRFAEGRNDVLPQLAHKLAEVKIDVIVAINTQATRLRRLGA